MSNYSDLIHEGENRVYEHVEHKCIERTVGENNSVSWKEHVLFPKNTLSDVFLTSHSKSTIENKISYYGNATKISSNILQVGVKDDIYDDFLKNGSHLTITFNGDYSNYAASTPFIPVIRLADTATGTTHLINGTTDVYLYKTDDEFISKDDISVGDTIEFIYRYKDADHKGLYMISGQKAYYNENQNEASLYVQTIDKYGRISSYRKASSDDIPFDNVDYNYLHSVIGLASSTKDGLMASTDYVKLHSFSEFNRAEWDKNGEKVYKVQMSSDNTDKNLYVQVPWSQDTDTRYVSDIVVNDFDNDDPNYIYNNQSQKSNDGTSPTANKKIAVRVTLNGTDGTKQNVKIGLKGTGNTFIESDINGIVTFGSNADRRDPNLFLLKNGEITNSSENDTEVQIASGYIIDSDSANPTYKNTGKHITVESDPTDDDILYMPSLSYDGTTRTIKLSLKHDTTRSQTRYLKVEHGGTGAKYFASGEVLIGSETGPFTTKAISTTVENKANLITSSAVYNKLADYATASSLSSYALKDNAPTFKTKRYNDIFYGTFNGSGNIMETTTTQYISAIYSVAIQDSYNILIITPAVSQYRTQKPIVIPFSNIKVVSNINEYGTFYWTPDVSMLDAYPKIVEENTRSELKAAAIEVKKNNGNLCIRVYSGDKARNIENASSTVVNSYKSIPIGITKLYIDIY